MKCAIVSFRLANHIDVTMCGKHAHSMVSCQDTSTDVSCARCFSLATWQAAMVTDYCIV